MARLKLKDVESVKRWAEISEDAPPQIWDVSSYREALRTDLRHIRVMITPIQPKPRKKPMKSGQPPTPKKTAEPRLKLSNGDRA